MWLYEIVYWCTINKNKGIYYEKKQKHPLKPERTDQFPHWPDLFHCSHAPSGSCFSPA